MLHRENQDATVFPVKHSLSEHHSIFLLPSGLLEGKLNDVLTGNASQGKPLHPGFALFGTMNSSDFSGRERLSSAFQNRVVYKREVDYSEKEFESIVRLE